MKRLRNVWLALKGELTMEALVGAKQEWLLAQSRYEEQLKRADLAAKLYNESEAGRKAASDALGQSVIDKMRSNPELFIPPKAKLLGDDE